MIALAAGLVGVIDSRLPGRFIEKLGADKPAVDIETILANGPAKPAAAPAPGDASPPSAPQPPGPDSIPVPATAPVPEPGPAPAPAPAQTAPKAHGKLENAVSIEQGKALHDRLLQMGDVTFVDARNAPEFEAGHVAGAINLSPDRFFGALPPELDAISREFIVVVYCGGGECDASQLVAKRFNEQGYNKVFIMEDGYPPWKAAGHPVEVKR